MSRVIEYPVCPTCKGEARVPIQGGLKTKACPRCGGRGALMPRK